ncbi:RNA-binding transcriptional accessory protein [Periweissella cryptocerci]|uniref:RNA-binding transcriptional accessory protein n=1 Tax=Periweissella cryptocerci TaxID=2506420 RepID=A0A4P6YUQ2_9LACO|nr:Tex family protein [Periweissella cryptocerci]QBO36482.1 RNA-binding transcriptional accessory protein [Periweissella cryptocerci]
MEPEILQAVIKTLSYRPKQVENVLSMLAEGNTVPFIARYRKERTQDLDEVQIREIQATAKTVTDLRDRKQTVVKAITEQGLLTPELQTKIDQAKTLQIVEDLYLPFKQKRRTKATIAKEQGLEPLANWLVSFPSGSVDAEAQKYVNDEVPDLEAVMNGVNEILAERIGENASYREWVRDFTWVKGMLAVSEKPKAKELDEQGVYQMYYEFSSRLNQLQSHQTLAINRGENEKVLKATIETDVDGILGHLRFKEIGNRQGKMADIVYAALEDAYKRFIGPAIERELRAKLTATASEQAINVFGENLYHLLMQAPLKGRIVMGFDPGFRTGSKLAVIDENGKFLAKQVIYPHKPASGKQRAEAADIFKDLIAKYQVELVAIGNGTASRESEEFVAANITAQTSYVIVNEAGASVYSASDAAREEFPDLHVEERSAVSIGRRLQDPLAELIKIDPKSVGVGQYQHDLPAKELDEQVDTVVETAVNQIGVNLNTASPQLLAHISGLNKTIANNIVNYRNENGEFLSRPQLKKVPRLGPKAYEQAVGFLRIVAGKNILDNTDIHPESYTIAKELLDKAGLNLKQVGTAATSVLSSLNNQATADEFGIGLSTLDDIIQGLSKPGRDVRDDMPGAVLRQDVLHIEDLQAGMKLQGTVRNVIDFGAFVDLGVKHDGLVHISRMAKKRIKHPSEIVAVGDIVDVWVVDVDTKRNRIGLSMLPLEEK